MNSKTVHENNTSNAPDHRVSLQPGTAGKNDITREIWLTRGLILVTLVASLFATADVGGIFLHYLRNGSLGGLVEQTVFILIVTFLVYGNLVYQFTRLGYLYRKARHRSADINALRKVYGSSGRGLAILVPSYKEEPEVVEQTLWSAALQVCPERRVVLLIDNPPNPSDFKDQRLLDVTKQLPGKIESALAREAGRYRAAYERYRGHELVDFRAETRNLSRLYKEASGWFLERAKQFPVNSHTDRLFVEKVFKEPAAIYRQHARSLSTRGNRNKNVILNREQIDQEYKRLMALFDVRLEFFERKKYINLSHEANKAMNLNSYLGLMGGSFCERKSGGDVCLEEAGNRQPDLVVPDTEFVITLDADSIIAHDYSARLIHQLDQPENRRVAVIQTPYSAVPDAPGVLERIAGATTDIQYIIHQGFTRYRATFWVGANALIRKKALEDIVTVDTERGFEVRRYIQDRTVIEDTESSVDLVDRGWSLLNYPERLAYSATPPDFGSLLIQRRRWANGGLIIFPKLLRYLFRRPRNMSKVSEGLVRSHYLTSITAVNVGLVLLFTYPFQDSMTTWWLPLAAVPYFFLYGRDLVSLNYRWSDLLRVYALNLALIPVNLGGVLKSISQAFTGEKIPFGRTPKREGRTAVPGAYVIALLALPAWCVAFTVIDAYFSRWGHALFSLFNGVFLVYAITRFVGWRDSLVDLGIVDETAERAAAPRTVEAEVVSLQAQRPKQQPALAAAVPVYANNQLRQGFVAEGRARLPEH